MLKPLKYDYSLMTKKAVGSHGINHKKVTALTPKMKKAHAGAHKVLSSGEQGFMKAVFKNDKEILKYADQVKKDFDQLLVIGIGGSDLGARALQESLVKNSKVRIFFLGDTLDPLEINKVCSEINWKKCAVNVVSKSGSTVETSSVFFYARSKLVKAVGRKNHSKHIFVTTEDKDSLLANLSRNYGYTLIPHPLTIGGRWTVLSIVALFSAAVAGIDISELKKGAKSMYNRCNKSYNNPAMIYATLHYLGAQKGQSLAVLMPYSSKLEKFGAWYRQLFAESLGKARSRQGKKVNAGLTPLVSVGPKDQHSQIQLYNDGPFDKLITFIRVENSCDSSKLPQHWGGENETSYLDGLSLHDLLNIEQESTEMALRGHGRPSGALSIPDLSEYSMGQLFMFFEMSCVYLAEMFDVNAFDQPGVEEGKKWMYTLLGREGYEKESVKYNKEKKRVKRLVA